MRETIWILGRGMLANLVYRALSGACNIVRRQGIPKTGIPKSARLCLVLEDEYRPSALFESEQLLRETGIPWLSGIVIHDEGVVGPWVRSGVPGCSHCARKRHSAAVGDQESHMELQLRLFRDGVVKRDRSASPWGLRIMCSLITAEVQRILQNDSVHLDGRVFLVDLHTLNSSLHAFLPDPLCEICGGLPDDTPDAARISLEPSPKIHSDSYRCRPMEQLERRLLGDYRDRRTGMMKTLTVEPSGPFCDVLVSLPTITGNEVTAGRSHSYQQSELTAILEGLERSCGVMPRGKRTMVYDCYDNLADRALHPASTGLYSPEQYALPDFPYEPFDPRAAIHWVWGYSFAQERPILIPEQMAYYNTGFGTRFVDEGSNGCALGGSLAEAVLHGLLEVVERDSFLLTWYAQLPVPRIDPHSVPDQELLLMTHRLEALAGYELYLFNATTENGIPSIWAMAKNKKNTGANLICSAGAHLDPVRAAKSAIFEIAAHSTYLNYMYETNREEYVQMLHDSDLVCEMPDHALLYAVPEAEERLHFLLQSDRPARAWADLFEPRTNRMDLADEVRELLHIFSRLKLDVIVVDQSTSETLRNGLYCVKVIVPGMLPMTFGHHLKRLAGLDRVLRVPKALGYTQRSLTLQDLNPHPHPFL